MKPYRPGRGGISRRLAWLALVGAALWTGTAHAQDGSRNDTRRSGFDFMGPSTQVLQRDDAQNPAMLWVAEGEQLFQRAPDARSQACAACHGEAKHSLRGAATRYPAFDEASGQALTLAGRINRCRVDAQGQAPHAPESEPLLSLETYVAMLSRGLPIAPPVDTRLDEARARGRSLYTQRLGLLNLSCAQCHDERAGGRLGGSVIPQAHPTGYPIYRLEWQGLGSLQRRLRNCMSGVRAEPFAYGAREWVDLELFLAQRAAGMPIETPAVRP